MNFYRFHKGKIPWILSIKVDWNSFKFTFWIASIGGFSVFYWAERDAYIGYESGYRIMKPKPDFKRSEPVELLEWCVWNHDVWERLT